MDGRPAFSGLWPLPHLAPWADPNQQRTYQHRSNTKAQNPTSPWISAAAPIAADSAPDPQVGHCVAEVLAIGDPEALHQLRVS